MIQLEPPRATGVVAGILFVFRKSGLLGPADHPENKMMNRVKKHCHPVYKVVTS